MVLNVQNAKEITIPEGDVKTIHDKDNRLLWGRVAYSTKYQGDTTQTTYTGKNLFGGLTFISKGNISSYSLSGNTLTITPSSTTLNMYIAFSLGTDIPAEQVHLHSDTKICDAFQLKDSDGQIVANFSASINGSRTLTGIADRVTLNYVATGTLDPFTVDLSTLIIEKGDSFTSYEPYVGGSPSPNPDYPQDINVVTGRQTVTIDGGTVTHDFTIDLGTLELGIIGSYQDYIYNSNNNWYKHADVGKATFDGSENWTKLNNAFQTTVLTPETHIGPAYSDYFTYYPTQVAITSNIPDGQFGWNTSRVPTFRNDSCADATAFKTWLSTHNTTIYYQLATATDTQITDATLISQLEAIYEWCRRAGYEQTVLAVSPNLPMIIYKGSLS